MSAVLRGMHDRIGVLARPEPTTGYGGRQARDWSAVTAVPERATIQPEGGDEDQQGRETVTSRLVATLTPATAVTSTSRVVFDGVVYEVDGDVESWRDRGRVKYRRALLQRVTDE